MELRIKEVIKSKGMTQLELAAKLGMSRVSLNTIINGNPTVSTVAKLANALGVEPWEFYITPEEVSSRNTGNGGFTCPCCGAALMMIRDNRGKSVELPNDVE